MLSSWAHVVTALSVLITHSEAATAAQWRSRSIFQVLTDRFARTDGSTTAACNSDGAAADQAYCGGTYQGMINHLDYIQGMGFDAVWISPVTKQIDDPSRAYHGYSQIDLYALNDHFGDLKALSTALHARGMYLMVDIVVNHFGAPGPADSINFGSMTPMDAQDMFHDICWVTDYTNTTNMQLCWLGTENDPLPDVDTTNPQIRTLYNSWISSLVSNYSIDGIRIDTVKHVENDFFQGFQKAAGVYAVGEYSDGGVDPVCGYQGNLNGVLQYPGYYQATSFFSSPSTSNSDFMSGLSAVNSTCGDPTLLGVFSENHDQPRFASKNADMTLAKQILTWTLLSDGIPIVFQGQEQHWSTSGSVQPRDALWFSKYDTTAELYQYVKTLNSIRKTAITSSSAWTTSRMRFVYSDSHNVAISKGSSPNSQVVSVLTNLGSTATDFDLNIGKAHGWVSGAQITDLVSCSKYTVASDGSLNVSVKAGMPVVLYPSAGTILCAVSAVKSQALEESSSQADNSKQEAFDSSAPSSSRPNLWYLCLATSAFLFFWL